jgi:hypothetical protein
VKINSPETMELLLESMSEFIRAQRETIRMIDQLQQQVDTLSAQNTPAHDVIGPDFSAQSSDQETEVNAAEHVHSADDDSQPNDIFDDNYEPDLPPMYPCVDEDHPLASCDGSQVHRLMGGLHGEVHAYRNVRDDPTDNLPILSPIVSNAPMQRGAFPCEEVNDQAAPDDDPSDLSDPEWAAANLSNTEPANAEPVQPAP